MFALTCLQIVVCSKDLYARQRATFRGCYTCSVSRRQHYVKKVMFMDDTTFDTNGIVNK